MIRIYKDKDTKVVTRGAYNTFYKPLGYKPIIEQEVVVEKPKKVEDKETTIQTSTRVTYSKRDNKKGE